MDPMIDVGSQPVTIVHKRPSSGSGNASMYVQIIRSPWRKDREITMSGDCEQYFGGIRFG